jgi:hypothetical protein
MTDWLDRPQYLPNPYQPSPQERRIAQLHPEVGWLCSLPPEERRWLGRKDRLAMLSLTHPAVTAEQWAFLLK